LFHLVSKRNINFADFTEKNLEQKLLILSMDTEKIKPWEQIDINKQKEGFDVWKEIDEYEEIIRKFFREEIHPDRFKSYRLNFGTYGVRHHPEGMHMQRIKIPSGFIFSEQLRVIADVVEKYAGSGHGHLTTRQDIQLHYVKLENVPDLLRKLSKVGITTREACGNTVRNITSSYLSGICPHEIFDVLPYAIYCTRYFLRHPLTSTLPRKFKIAFSECEKDEALVRIHDIGAVAQIIKNGKEQRGFKVYVGGGLGPVPVEAKLLADFVKDYELYPLIESVIYVFHKYGTEERKFRNKARLKFLIARIGFEKFKDLVIQEFERLKKVREEIKDELIQYVENFPLPAPTKTGREDGPQNEKRLKQPKTKPNFSDPKFKFFFEKYTFKQKQNGYFGVYVKPPLGNLKPNEFRAIADLAELYGAGYVRITPGQKILIPWVEEKFLYDIYIELSEKGFINGKVPESAREIVSCPGAFSCKLAVTHPYNLAEYIGENVEDLGGLRIHISGCPNSCGQHHIGDIGFYGASAKVDGKIAPYYIVLMGGYGFEQKAKFGEVIGRIPAKTAPFFVKEVVELWKKERKDGEKFYEFVERIGEEKFKEILAKHSKVSPSDPDVFREPGISDEFKMEAEARGECAGSLIDLMAVNLFDSFRNIYDIKVEEKVYGVKRDSIKEKILDSIMKCAKMYDYLEGEEPQEEEKILNIFVERILPKRWFCSDWSDLKQKYYEIKSEDFEKISEEKIREFIKYATDFVKDAEKAFVRLKPNLKIQECLRQKEEHVPGE
jgi:sulfite reductase beta subunit-like hemoprotein